MIRARITRRSRELTAAAVVILGVITAVSFAAFTDDASVTVSVAGAFDTKISDPSASVACSADAATPNTAVLAADNAAGQVVAYDSGNPDKPTATYDVTVCNTSQVATGNLFFALRNARSTRSGAAAVGGIDPFDHLMFSVTDVTVPASPQSRIVHKTVSEINAGGGTALSGATLPKASNATTPGQMTFRISVWLDPSSPGFQEAAYGQAVYPGIVISTESNLLSGTTDLQGVFG